MINVWQNLKERAKILSDMEQDGDAITHNIMNLLRCSFITPIDREDISSLANSMDNIADRIHAVADTLYLYRVEGPTKRAKELCDILLIAVIEVSGGISELSSGIRHPELHQRCVTINQIENSGDLVYRTALAELFENPSDMAYIVKWREVYKKLEAAIDGCENLADILEGIAIKNE
jgi:uncharacterized protein Yka (UPF0111/DUF47 family)